MARNDDEAARRRAKRRERLGEDAVPEPSTSANEAEESLSPATDGSEANEPALVGETLRAETDAHSGISGTPVGIGDPETEGGPRSELEPKAGGITVGGEATGTGGPRVIRFFKASWAELKRVRWPNRQQVAQGTAVTLGFVVIAGAFLGLADVVARQIVNLIL